MKPLENSEKSERSSLFPSILEACKQEYVEVNDRGIYGEDDLQQKLKSAMINNVLPSKVNKLKLIDYKWAILSLQKFNIIFCLKLEIL